MTTKLYVSRQQNGLFTLTFLAPPKVAQVVGTAALGLYPLPGDAVFIQSQCAEMIEKICGVADARHMRRLHYTIVEGGFTTVGEPIPLDMPVVR